MDERDVCAAIDAATPEELAPMVELFRDRAPNTTADDIRAILRHEARKKIEAEKNYDGMEALRDEGCNAESEAFSRLTNTIPTTAAGAFALLSLIVEESEKGPETSGSILSMTFEHDDAQALLANLKEFHSVQAKAVQS
jgi:hypothetical protein